MEFGTTKINWEQYEQNLALGEFLTHGCKKAFRCNDPPDAGSLNTALSDFFPLLALHLPQKTRDAIEPFVGAIATCGIAG